MLCQNCKRNEANVHMKRIINASATEVHLCEDCARALGYGDAFSGFGLGLGDLFGNLISHSSVFSGTNAVRCPMCGNGFNDIAESGRLGCAECFDTFYDKLLPSIERIHGNNKHVGKRIVKGTDNPDYLREEEDLQAELEKAVREQNFELAAELRDKIKQREKEKTEEHNKREDK
jgi:protein arginine kinase activator